MKQVVEKWGHKFLERVFTEKEISYCYAKKEPHLSLAVRFAAKEALIKAVGSASPVSLKDIEVMNTESGKPLLRVVGTLERFLKENCIRQVHLVSFRRVEDVQRYTVDAIADVRVSDEGQEGLKAFLEKRKPSWQA